MMQFITAHCESQMNLKGKLTHVTTSWAYQHNLTRIKVKIFCKGVKRLAH